MGCMSSLPYGASSSSKYRNRSIISRDSSRKVPPWEEENTSVNIDELNRDLQRRKAEEEEYERQLYEEKERLRILSVSLIG